jgi:tetratricopeptide (TPR) repeat protein
MKVSAVKSSFLSGAYVCFCLTTVAHAKPQWISVEAKDFVIVSNGSGKEVQYLAEKLEAFRSVMTRMFGLRWASDRPLTIVAFRDWASFEEFELAGFAAGQFMNDAAEDMVIIVLLDSKAFTSGMDAENILLHEYTHVLTASSIPNWPPWLREGIADVYSTFQIEGDKAVIGIPAKFRLPTVRSHYLIPMQGFLKQNPKGHDINSPGMFYPQAWALAHYLMFGEKRANLDKFVEYAHRCESGIDSEQAFRDVFKVDYKTLENKLTEYVKREEFPGLQIEYASLDVQKEFKTGPLSETELQTCYGNLMLNWFEARGETRSIHLQYRTFDAKHRAEYYFQKALALDPLNYRAHEGYGLLQLKREVYKDAREHFEKALQLKPDSAEAHYLIGLALYGEASGSIYSYAEEVPPETAKAIFDEATTALKLNPRKAEAYDLLARLCLCPGENLDEGLRLINSALRASPRDYQMQLTRGQLLYRKGDYAAARKTLTALIDDDEKVAYKIRMGAKRILNNVEHAQAKH